MNDSHRFLCEAIGLAHSNVKNGGRPFGAVVVRRGEIIASGVARDKSCASADIRCSAAHGAAPLGCLRTLSSWARAAAPTNRCNRADGL